MAGVPKKLPHRRFLYDLARIHHKNPVCHIGNQANVMGNQYHCHSCFPLEGSKQLHDLCLDGNIQCRGRLVRNQKPWITGQRHGDHHPLAHPSRQGMGKLFHSPPGIRHPHFPEKPLCAPCRLFLWQMHMRPDTFRDLVPHCKNRIQGRKGILKNHSDLVPP